MAAAQDAWSQLDASDDMNFRLSAAVGLGSIFYMEGYKVKEQLESISSSDGETYGKARRQYNELMNKSYQSYIKGEEYIPDLVESNVTVLEENGAAEYRIDEAREHLYNDYTSILNTLTKLFELSMEMELLNDYRLRLERVEEGQLVLKPHPDLPDELIFN